MISFLQIVILIPILLYICLYFYSIFYNYSSIISNLQVISISIIDIYYQFINPLILKEAQNVINNKILNEFEAQLIVNECKTCVQIESFIKSGLK